MNDTPDNNARKTLVVVILEQVLLGMGRPVYDEVAHQLYENYNCGLEDCYENPGYLRKVLQDLYGPSHASIIESIRKQLYEYEARDGIREFVTGIST